MRARGGKALRSLITALVTLVALSTSSTGPAEAAPGAKLWPRWQAHDPAATTTIDHSVWAQLLESHVVRGADGINRVAYAGFSAADSAALDQYLGDLAATPISRFDRPEQMAYWINLYNALTLRVVLDHYPVDSIRDIDISPGLFSDGPWGKKLIEVEGEAVSLDDIEHRILRPIWRDPRVHYAVNCASLGCPNLALEPYLGATIDAQLDAAARDFVNSGRAVQFEGMDLVVSSIYDWFQEDFGSSDQDVIDHLMTYAEPKLDMTLEGFSTIDDDRYDWALNDASPS